MVLTSQAPVALSGHGVAMLIFAALIFALFI